MSRRLLQRGRYPKDPFFQQPNNGNQQHQQQQQPQYFQSAYNPPGTCVPLFNMQPEQAGHDSTSNTQQLNVTSQSQVYSQPSMPWQSEHAPQVPVSDPWKWNSVGSSAAVDGYQKPQIFQPDQQFSQSNQQYHVLNHQYLQSNQQLSQSDQQFPQSDQQFSQSDQKYSQSNIQFSQLNQQFPQTNQQLSQSDQQFSQVNQQFSQADQQFFPSNQLTESTQQFYNPDSQFPQSNNWQPTQSQLPVSTYNNYSNSNVSPTTSSSCNEALPTQNDWNPSTVDMQNQNSTLPIQSQQMQPWEYSNTTQPGQSALSYDASQNYERSQYDWQSNSAPQGNINSLAAGGESPSKTAQEQESLSNYNVSNDYEKNYLLNHKNERHSNRNSPAVDVAEVSQDSSYPVQDTDSSECADFHSRNCISENSATSSEMKKDFTDDAESGNGSLSNFFSNDIEEQPYDCGKNVSSNVLNRQEEDSCLEESMANIQIAVTEGDSVEIEKGDCLSNPHVHDYRTSSTFIQNESSGNNLERLKLEAPSLSPILFAEEPLNKEVPEPTDSAPSLSTIGGSQEMTVKLGSDECPEEPFNQQIPVMSDTATSVQERKKTFPAEESAFTPVLKQHEKGIVIQQETNATCMEFIETSKEKENSQDVNLETIPDNLERPPDHDELKKHSARHRLHLKTESKDSIPSTSLWDSPDIPCITLVPAAPLAVAASLSSSKVDQNIKCQDGERVMERNSDITETANLESTTNEIKYNQKSSPNVETISSTITEPSTSSYTESNIVNNKEKIKVKPQTPVPSNSSIVDTHISHSTSTRSSASVSEQKTDISPSLIKESKVVANAPVLSETQKYSVPKYEEADFENAQKPNPPKFTQRRGAQYVEEKPQGMSYHGQLRMEEKRQMESRQQFADSRGNSYDERYYSDRPSSRPSSRMSLHEPLEEYTHRDHRRCPPNYERPPSRHSESDHYRSGSSHEPLEDYTHRDHRRYPPNYERPPSRHSESDHYRSGSSHEPLEDYTHRDHRRYPPNYERPPSRHSESDHYRSGNVPGRYPYDPSYPYAPYSNSREEEYSARPRDYRGYEYDYYRQPAHPYYYDPYMYQNYNYGFIDELCRTDPRYREYYKEYYKRLGIDIDYERSSIPSGRSSVNELTKNMPAKYPEPDRDMAQQADYASYNQQYYQYEDQRSHNSSVISNEQAVASISSGRLTPAKFSYEHPVARFCNNGTLLTIMPKQTTCTPAAPVEFHDIQLIMEQVESYDDLKNYQGPLIRGETHKNDVVDFCLQKIALLKEKKDVFDRESYILLWELMVLLIRQNGSVAGTDISQLLLKDHEVLRSPLVKPSAETPLTDNSPADNNSDHPHHASRDGTSPDEGIVVTEDRSILNTSKTLDVDKVTRKFREFLLFGHKKDALEWAMKHGLWGHALFLASKMDLRTYANVMTRFANSLALNDPLQTLYQLMSGRQPAAVTCVADKQWGDWRPHLAMILSNPSSHADVDSRSITTLGDTLAARGCLAAAHFCYLMAQVEFGSYTRKSSKLVLLGANHLLPFEEFATNEAIQCTEIYEYAQSLANPQFMLHHLQAYKFLYATRLADHGLLQEALHYCEILSCSFKTDPQSFSVDLIKGVFELSSQLKYHDPVFMQGQGELEEQEDPEWLKNLVNLLNYLQNDSSYPVNDYGVTSSDVNENIENSSASINETSVQQMSNESNLMQQPVSMLSQTNYNLLYESKQETYQHINMEASRDVVSHQQSHLENNHQTNREAERQFSNPEIHYEGHYNQFNQQNYGNNAVWAEQGVAPNNEINTYGNSYYTEPPVNQWNSSGEKSSSVFEASESVPEISSTNQNTSSAFDYYSSNMQQPSHVTRQQSRERTNSSSSVITQRERSDSTRSSNNGYGATATVSSTRNRNASSDSNKVEKKEKSNSQVGRTWLGGIFSKLLPRGPNQMILPDDKNPTIIWDSSKNCWINNDNDGDDESNQPVAPPTDVELMYKNFSEPVHSSPLPPSSSVSPPATTSPTNRFQRPKIKSMRQNYVDILNPTSSAPKQAPVTDILFPPPPVQPISTKMFIPSASLNEEENVNYMNNNQPMSSNMPSAETTDSASKVPRMFDPAEFDSRRSSIASLRHSVGPARRAYPT